MSSSYEATFDYICHPLQCLHCGEVVPNPCDIDLQTKVALVKKLRTLQVGDYLELAPNLQEGGGYLELKEVHELGKLTVIETWSCPTCGANFLWANVVFEEGFLKSVETIELNENTLSSADFITSEVLFLIPMERTLEIKQLPPQQLRVELLAAAAIHHREKESMDK